MIPLQLPEERVAVLGLAAHPDDLEIGAGGLLAKLAEFGGPRIAITATSAERRAEARGAWKELHPLSEHVQSINLGLDDGRLDGQRRYLKEYLEHYADALPVPDIILAPRLDDGHPDHRTLAEAVTTVWRDSLVLRYELPKLADDLGRAPLLLPLLPEELDDKIRLLERHYGGSQGMRHWWGRETFAAIARLRGVQCRSPYAEAFTTEKLELRI